MRGRRAYHRPLIRSLGYHIMVPCLITLGTSQALVEEHSQKQQRIDQVPLPPAETRRAGRQKRTKIFLPCSTLEATWQRRRFQARVVQSDQSSHSSQRDVFETDQAVVGQGCNLVSFRLAPHRLAFCPLPSAAELHPFINAVPVSLDFTPVYSLS